MHDFSAREMTPGAVHFAGVANGGSFARLKPPVAATAMKTAAADRIGRNAPAAQIPRARVCSGCKLPGGSCQRKKIGRSGRWFPTEPASSSTARGRRGRTIVPNPLQSPMSKTV